MLNKIMIVKCLSNHYQKSLSNIFIMFNYESDKIGILGLFRSLNNYCVSVCVSMYVSMGTDTMHWAS